MKPEAAGWSEQEWPEKRARMAFGPDLWFLAQKKFNEFNRGDSLQLWLQ